MKNDICALCKEESELHLSHIIPRFISKWLKKTSATNYIRAYSGKRKQDSFKRFLLCRECEQLFSNYESYFASKFFYPLIKDSRIIKFITYDERLLKFIISVNWRILHDFLEEKDKNKNTEFTKLLDNWNKYLNNYTDKLLNSNYLIFHDFNEPETTNDFKYISYISSLSDAGVLSNKIGTKLVFTQIPFFTLISTIKQLEGYNLENLEIYTKGKFIPFVSFFSLDIVSLFISRIELMDKVNLSKRDNKKILKELLKDMEKTKSSRSYNTFTNEMKRYLERKSK